ncbi:MAG TPA: hypothetical protein VHZ50_00820 [Puia sp.]|nr:hypothetical protein [Puia sp.]
MKNLTPIARIFYCVGIIGIAAQQFYYNDFRPVLIPQWPEWLPTILIWANITGAILIVLSVCILIKKNEKNAALILGGFLLFLFLVFQVPYMLFVFPYTWHLGVWTNPLKTLALSGGAFVVAGSFSTAVAKNSLMKFLSAFISCGKIFFSIMLISFGIDHFLYADGVKDLVPGWIPGHIFWTYVAGVLLIGTGVAIILNIKRRLVSMLAGIMLLAWFLILHIPRAVAHPEMEKGNEITSVFEALAFSGIAFLIAQATYKNKNE